MLKRLTALLLVVGLLLCGCSGRQSTWQESYDLGVRYLSEGNYQEAILAFSAAIYIDPKQPDAYEGRADAYTMAAEAEPDKAEIYLANAIKDYETAKELTSGDTSHLDQKMEAVSVLLNSSATSAPTEEAVPETSPETVPETVPDYIGYDVQYEYFTDYLEEYCVLTGTDPQGNVAWVHESGLYEFVQLEKLSYVGTFEDRCYYVEDGSLVALDIRTGSLLWTNSEFQGCPVNESATYIDELGYICLTGYFGPDFMVVDPQGNTVKRIASFDPNYFWPYKLERVGDQLLIHMEAGPEGSMPEGYEFYVDIDWHTDSLSGPPQTMDAAIALVERLYNALFEDDGTYVVFAEECFDNGNSYTLTVRYQLSDEEAERILANGGMPSANTLADTATVDKATGRVTSAMGYDLGQ